jgi:hypothetical protein
MKIIYTSLASLLLSNLASLGGDAKGKVEEEIRKEILKSTTVTISSEIQDIGLSKCFGATFYKVEIDTKGLWNTQAIYAKTGETMLLVPTPPVEVKLPELLGLLKASFRMTTEEDGLTMMAAIKAIYPSYLDEDYTPRIVRKNNKWFFIVDKFFRKFSGIVMETDATGRITGIERSLSITE